jgi:hypothetical protein
MKRIGTLSENSLHAAIKQFLRMPGDQLEQPLGSYIIDIVRDHTLYEVQIKNFYSLRPKLTRLLDSYAVHIVFPIPVKKWILRKDADGHPNKRRKSPKKGSIYQLFNQVVYLPDYLPHPNLFIDILFIEQEDIWINDGKGSWRRKGWSLFDQRLLHVLESKQFCGVDDYQKLLPSDLPVLFRNIDLSTTAKIPLPLARKMTYTLTKAGILVMQGKAGKSNLYMLSESSNG